jgi:hypothetical protein
MLSLCFLVFVSHGTKQNPKGWVSIQTGQVDPLDPFILNGFTGSCRVTREFSRVYPLDTFIKWGVYGFVLNGSRVNRVINGSCRVTRFANPSYFGNSFGEFIYHFSFTQTQVYTLSLRGMLRILLYVRLFFIFLSLSFMFFMLLFSNLNV